MAAAPLPLVIEVLEETTFKYTTVLKDDATPAVAVPLAAINSIVLSLRERASGDVVNSRDAQDVKNANNGTMHATSGLFTWDIQQGDTAIVGETEAGQVEEHLGTLTVIYGTTKKVTREFLLRVTSLQDVT